MSVLLDTHVLLWWKGEPSRLSREARRLIGKGDGTRISTISLWEITTLHRGGRIALDRETHTWVRDLLSEGDIELAELTPEIAVDAGDLDGAFPGDAADRLIYATAMDVRIPLLTKDERLHRYAETDRRVRVVW